MIERCWYRMVGKEIIEGVHSVEWLVERRQVAFCSKPRALLAPHFWSLLSDDNPVEDDHDEDDND